MIYDVLKSSSAVLILMTGVMACDSQPAPSTAAPEAGTTAAAARVPGEGPDIFFSEDSHDFGAVASGEVLKHTFVFSNRGKGVLELGQPKGS